MNTIRVIARPGIRVPMEGMPRRYITAEESVLVPATPYYIRQIADGDLVIVEALPEEAP